MKPRLLKILACPLCKSHLDLASSKKIEKLPSENYPENLICQGFCSHRPEEYTCKKCLDTEIIEGTLKCSNCQRTYEIIDSIPNLIKENQGSTWDDFNYFQDTIEGFSKFQLETVFKALLPPKIAPDFLKNKIILDAGCGGGFFINAIAKSIEGEIVGFDIGSCVYESLQRNQRFRNAHIIRADINELPFKKQIFDFVYSVYVIHLLKSPKAGFAKLAYLVKAGGILTVSVYPNKGLGFTVFHGIIRGITTKLPSKLLFYLCFIPVPLLSIFKTMSGASLKNQSWTKCAVLLYIFYAIKHFHQFPEKEVLNWFREAGFGELEPLVHPVTITGKKKKK